MPEEHNNVGSRTKGYLLLMAILMSISLALAGCGGGGGGSADGPGSNPSADNTGGTDGTDGTGGSGGSAQTAAYRFFAANGNLYAVDPAAPTAPPKLVDTETSRAATSGRVSNVWAGSYDPAAQTLSDLHARALIYRKGGQLYKVSALKGSSLTPVRLSNETGLTDVCNAGVGTDFVNPDNSIFHYSLPGPDGSCGTGDDVFRMVKVGMGPNDPPLPAKDDLTVLHDANLSITGFLVMEGNTLTRYDSDFSPGSAIALGTFGSPLARARGGLTKSFLVLAERVHVYDDVTRTLSPALYFFTDSDWLSDHDVESDGDTFFFTDGPKILSVPADGTAPATLLATVAGIDTLTLTTNKVVLYGYGELYSVNFDI